MDTTTWPKLIPEIDFIKGFAILSVIILHCFSTELLLDSYAVFHIWQAVPLFVLVSFFLLFKKLDTSSGNYFIKDSFKKLFRRIVLPFLLIEAVMIILQLLKSGINPAITSLKQLGIGAGAYYPFIYLQIWLLSPFIFRLLKSKGVLIGGGMVLIINVLCNIMCAEVLQEWIYSRLLTRYLFLSVLAYAWYIKEINLKKAVLLSLVSIGYYFAILNFETEFTPWLDNRWSIHQIPAFFYTMFLALLLSKLFTWIRDGKISQLFIYLGKNSYELFLFQMFYLALLSIVGTFFNKYIGELLGCVAYTVIILTSCLITTFLKNKFVKK